MTMNETIAAIHQTTDEIVELTKGLSDELILWKPTEEKWSIQEVVCHLEEAIPYWLHELQDTLKKPAPWGRGLQHEGRLAAVSQAHQRSTADALEGLANTKQQVETILGSIGEDDLKLEAESRNPRFGIKPMSFIIDHLLTDHLVTHLKQIRRNIEQFEARKLTN